MSFGKRWAWPGCGPSINGCDGLAGGVQWLQKKLRPLPRRARGTGRAHTQDRPEPLVCRLQETHVAVMAAHRASVRDTCAAGQLGNVAAGGLLRPSLHWCRRPLGWWPGIIVAAMGYLSAADKQAVRTGWQCAVVTKLRADMKLVPPDVSAAHVECPQGQRLAWWEYEPASGPQWFRAPGKPELCAHCWEAARCPRHFGCPVGQHETLFGLLPLASRLAQRLLRQVRPGIEPAQSFEKNQLGLGQMLFNSLRLTWQMSL